MTDERGADRDDATPRNIYDWWSRHPRLLDALYAASFLGRERGFRVRALDALDPSAGETVLEVGCGRGRDFDRLTTRLGSAGRVIGVDASKGMVAEARRTAATLDPPPAVLRGDASQLPVATDSVDAAYAAMSLTAMPDPEATIADVARVIRPDGRFTVLDARGLQSSPWDVLNYVVEPISRRLTNWNTDVDIPGALAEYFERVETDTYTGGAILIATAWNPR